MRGSKHMPKKPVPTLELVLTDDVNGSGTVNYGDSFTFTSDTPTPQSEVGVRCVQGSAFVFDGYISLFDSPLNRPLTFTSTNWDPDGPPAACVARLFHYNKRGYQEVETSIAFEVGQ
jgi:hypothetical protein